jgi:hypothetical protein
MSMLVALVVVASSSIVECRYARTPEEMYGRFYHLWLEDAGSDEDGSKKAKVKNMSSSESAEARRCLFSADEKGACAATFTLEMLYRNGEPSLAISLNVDTADVYKEKFKERCQSVRAIQQGATQSYK